jgi:hypothetical protein
MGGARSAKGSQGQKVNSFSKKGKKEKKKNSVMKTFLNYRRTTNRG